MNESDFKYAVELLIRKAPIGWKQLQVCYQFYDDAAKINTYKKKEGSSDWQSFDFGGFELMDFFDEYRIKNHPKLNEPWSIVTITVNENKDFSIEFGYGDPGILAV